MKKLSKRHIELAHYRWEFCRRDPEYLAAWEEVKRLRKSANPPKGTIAERHGKDGKLLYLRDLYMHTEEYRREREIFAHFGYSLAPDFSAEKALSEWDVVYSERQIARAITGVLGAAISTPNMMNCRYDKSKTPLELLLLIDFEKVDSIGNLKAEIEELLDMHWMIAKVCKSQSYEEAVSIILEKDSAYFDSVVSSIRDLDLMNLVDRKLMQLEKSSRARQEKNRPVPCKKAKPNDYALVLSVGDAYNAVVEEHPDYLDGRGKKGFLWEGVKRRIPHYKDKSAESAIKSIQHQYRSYVHLVNGGWRDIKYP